MKPSSPYIRPTWDEYFLEVMHSLAKRATCDRGRTACVIVKDHQIVVSGYVGSPPGLPHCDEVGHLLKTLTHEDGTTSTHCMRTIHAEQNAICQAAKRGVSVDGATMYCKLAPCRTCAMLLISAGIKRVVAEYRYHAGGESEQMLHAAGVALEYIHDETLVYDHEKTA
ncbi:MAG: deoxycytidylate deaminase [Alphaproteobacteria bacterium]